MYPITRKRKGTFFFLSWTNNNNNAAATNKDDDESIQLFRPVGSNLAATDFLYRHDDDVTITEDVVNSFLSGETNYYRFSASHDDDVCDDLSGKKNEMMLLKAYHERRREVRQLAEDLKKGRARIDVDGRLIPVSQPPQPPRANLPAPLPPPPPQGIHQQQQQPPEMNFGQNQHAEEAPWAEQERQEAADAIARAVRSYRSQNVPEDEFELVLIEPRRGGAGGGGGHAGATFRRIIVVFFAIFAAFVCIVLQTLPILRDREVVDHTFDKLMYELLHVRHLSLHAKNCPGLHRQQQQSTWYTPIRKWMGIFMEEDCDAGVLHIPVKHVLLKQYMESENKQESASLEPYVVGINTSWFFPCQSGPSIRNTTTCTTGEESLQDHGNGEDMDHGRFKCFRGLHDNLVPHRHIYQVLRLGRQLILNGGDHFTIHYDVSHLESHAPEVVDILKTLLHQRYYIDTIRPVAFRVYSAGPMDGHGVQFFRGLEFYHSLVQTLNETMYLDWVEKNRRINEIAEYSPPWPFRTPPVRDTCKLVADMEVDARFSIHTSVFLSDGAGDEYSGGASLYVDNDEVNNKRLKGKIRRGLSFDGSKGRVAVSTGGIENLRCKLPIRAGVRSVLQVWWDTG